MLHWQANPFGMLQRACLGDKRIYTLSPVRCAALQWCMHACFKPCHTVTNMLTPLGPAVLCQAWLTCCLATCCRKRLRRCRRRAVAACHAARTCPCFRVAMRTSALHWRSSRPSASWHVPSCQRRRYEACSNITSTQADDLLFDWQSLSFSDA